jgi:hypothetical protein
MYSRSTRKLRTAVIGREEEEPGQLLILTVINVACEIHSEGYPCTTTTVGTGIIHLRPYATNTAVGHENVAREIQSLFSRE